MKLFEFVHWKTKNWYFEYSIFTKYEGAALHIDFVLPTPKEKIFQFGFTIFTLTFFFIEIARVKQQ